MKNYTFLALLIVLFSCTPKETISEIDVEPVLENILSDHLGPFIATHVVTSNGKVMDNSRTKDLEIYLGEMVELLETKPVENIGETVFIWHKIRTKSDTVGWCLDDYLVNISGIDLSQISLNKIDSKIFSFINETGEKIETEVTGDFKRNIYWYGMNLIVIEYFYKNADFDTGDILTMYQRNSIVYNFLCDIFVFKGLGNFPDYWGYSNIRINNKNGIKCIDSFNFIEGPTYESGYIIGFQRIVQISTNNYCIKISMQLMDDNKKNMNQIISDTPKFFKIDLSENYFKWDEENNAKSKFGSELIK